MFRAARMNVAPGATLPRAPPTQAATGAGATPREPALAGLRFAMQGGELMVAGGVESDGAAQRRRRGERKDRALCERLAKLAVEYPTVTVRTAAVIATLLTCETTCHLVLVAPTHTLYI